MTVWGTVSFAGKSSSRNTRLFSVLMPLDNPLCYSKTLHIATETSVVAALF
jgi:hypothetical protein